MLCIVAMCKMRDVLSSIDTRALQSSHDWADSASERNSWGLHLAFAVCNALHRGMARASCRRRDRRRSTGEVRTDDHDYIDPSDSSHGRGHR